jgi:hypothetical protein
MHRLFVFMARSIRLPSTERKDRWLQKYGVWLQTPWRRERVHLVRRSISDLVSDLDPELFCRIHRSVIVNLRRVTGLEVDGTGEYEVVLHGGQKLRLSRRFRKDFMARMNTSPMRV